MAKITSHELFELFHNYTKWEMLAIQAFVGRSKSVEEYFTSCLFVYQLLFELRSIEHDYIQSYKQCQVSSVRKASE